MTTSPEPRQCDVCGQDSPVADLMVSGSTVCASFGLRGSVNTSNAARTKHSTISRSFVAKFSVGLAPICMVQSGYAADHKQHSRAWHEQC